MAGKTTPHLSAKPPPLAAATPNVAATATTVPATTPAVSATTTATTGVGCDGDKGNDEEQHRGNADAGFQRRPRISESWPISIPPQAEPQTDERILAAESF